MAEKWLEAHIFLTAQLSNSLRRILLDVVQHSANELESKKMRKTFHYLLEPRIDGKEGFEILYRIEDSDVSVLEDIEKLVSDRINQLKQLYDGYQITREYSGESKDFGEDGWELVKRLFEIGSKIAIAHIDSQFRKGEKFNAGKLIHCFLNQHVVDETQFHADALVGRVVLNMGVHSITPEVEANARSLLERTLGNLRTRGIRTQ